MKTNLLKSFLLACLLVCVTGTVRAAEEDDLIATLQSAADATQKSAACQKLRVIGTPKSVPALAALLGDERNSQMARYVLEGMPHAEAGAALRAALGKTSGLLKAGVVDSLGWRRDAEALPLLTPLLSDADAVIAGAAASALGRIGGKEAVAALTAARAKAPAAVQPVIIEGLMKCAETLLAGGDGAGAAAIYRDLLAGELPVNVRAACWRGLVLADTGQRTDLLTKALAGADRPMRMAAQKLVRELDDAALIKACVAQWASLPADSQVAVLDAHVKLGAESLPTIRAAATSPNVAVRIAAWEAMAVVSSPETVPALARAAARGEPAEREAARTALARVRGPGIREALIGSLDALEAPESAEVLRALGERGDTAAAAVLVRHVSAEAEAVRLAALESLRRLAVADTIAPLLDLAAKSKSDAQRDPIIQALHAICRAAPDKARTARQVVESIGRFPVAERRQVLPLLAELGTAEALAAAQAATRDADVELAKEGVRVLGRWPNAAPASHLMEMARAGADPALRTLALRGAITVAGQEPDAGKRLALLAQAMAAANRNEEKKQALGQLGQTPTREALELVMKHLDDPALLNEAALAAVSIAAKLAPSNPKLADETAVKVLALVKEGDVAKRAWELRIKPSSAASFISDWAVCGPYRKEGAAGAEALFNIAFGPEKPGEKVEWRHVPRAEHVNLSAIFPGQDNCAAYLRTNIIAPGDCAGALLMGSDDGIKAWLNGEVVHSNNVDRGEVADQDRAPIKLKKGTNELMLKISQGGGGWSACARIVGTDGKPIPGLMVERPDAPKAGK